MNKQEFEQRIVNAKNAKEVKILIIQRIDSLCDEFAPHGPTNAFEVFSRVVVFKALYESLYNTLPQELKKLFDNMVKDTAVIAIVRDINEGAN